MSNREELTFKPRARRRSRRPYLLVLMATAVAVCGAGNLKATNGPEKPVVRRPTVCINIGSITRADGDGRAILARGSVVAVFGERLANQPRRRQNAFPSMLAGSRVQVQTEDHISDARLSYVSPGQVNFLLPSDSKGAAEILITNANGHTSTCPVVIDPGESAFVIDSSESALAVRKGDGGAQETWAASTNESITAAQYWGHDNGTQYVAVYGAFYNPGAFWVIPCPFYANGSPLAESYTASRIYWSSSQFNLAVTRQVPSPNGYNLSCLAQIWDAQGRVITSAPVSLPPTSLGSCRIDTPPGCP